MGYCTETDVKKVIAQALTTATANTPNDFGTFSNLINVGNELDKNLVTSDIVAYYIQMADSDIDSLLSALYVAPFCEKIDFETSLYSAINEYNQYIVVDRACPLTSGDIILIVSGEMEERHEIDELIAMGTFSTVSAIQYFFPEDSRVLRVTYPPPLRFISARLAAAAIYDKYFASESAPNVSKFGDKMRGLAYDRINDVLGGRIILHGSHRIGRRFYNSNLVDQYGLPDDKKGEISRNPQG